MFLAHYKALCSADNNVPSEWPFLKTSGLRTSQLLLVDTAATTPMAATNKK